MKIQNAVKSILVAAAIPVLVLGAAGSSSADGFVTWKNKKTDHFLMHTWGGDGPVSGGLPGASKQGEWYDVQNSDGSYNQQFGSSCLTGYWRQVYTEPCDNGGGRDKTNWYQRWYEISTSTGWKLKNVQTKYILDDAGSSLDNPNTIYANSGDVGSQNQRWR